MHFFLSLSLFCLFVLEQIENIDACLSFLAAKGINIQGLSAEGESNFFLNEQPELVLEVVTGTWAVMED